ncbi:hypothetical protein, partial [uncultured Fretibacterium sp.]|uniref:hypothetical protein n=1 Tax=uncultured Fretibacterium sp. TaxID=1678694 RepID=UPI00325FBB4A
SPFSEGSVRRKLHEGSAPWDYNGFIIDRGVAVPFSLPLAVPSFLPALPENDWEGAMQAGGEFGINTGK